MNADHWILLGLWVLFGLLHSLLAAGVVKGAIQKAIGRFGRYYRLLYSIWALVSLTAVLVWQIVIPSPSLTGFGTARHVAGVLAGAGGLLLMGICARLYFFDISGLAVFFPGREPGQLSFGGIHRHVRHPLYLGTLLAAAGILSCWPSLSNAIAFGSMIVYTLLGIHFEERKLLIVFGDSYAAYRRRTPMLIPGIWRTGKRKDA